MSRVLVVGLGSIGSRHYANAAALGHDVAAVSRRGEFGTLDEAAAWRPDALVVATPTSEHAAALRWAVEHDVPALVEKPLAARSSDVRDLLGRGVRVAVGCNLRFHPALRAIAGAVRDGRIGRLLYARAEVGQYLPDWQSGRDYREGYAARAELGGGALLTLIHELDLVYWIGGEVAAVTGVRARVSDLELDVDDLAELVCRHESGAISSVHMDFLDRSYNRRSRWVGSDGTIEWSWGTPVALDGEVLWADAAYDLAESYVDELAAFLAGDPGTTGAEGLRVLELAESVTE